MNREKERGVNHVVSTRGLSGFFFVVSSGYPVGRAVTLKARRREKMALRAALLRHVRVPVRALTLTGRTSEQSLSGFGSLFRSMSSHDDHITKEEVIERVLSVVKSFPKVDPSKV